MTQDRITRPLTTLLAAAVLTIGAAAPTAAQQQSGSVDGALVAFALPLVERATAIAAVWPGFWSDAPRFVVLRDQQSALLISDSDPGEDYSPVNGPYVPQPLHGMLFLRHAYPPQLGPRSFSLRHVIGTDTVPALEPQGSSLFTRTDFYLHEAFHGFQIAAFADLPEDSRRVRFGEHLVDPANLADDFSDAVDRERVLLLAAVRADADARAGIVREYLAARAARIARSPDTDAVERSMERREGTATYVGCRSAAVALGAPAPAARECMVARLALPLDDMPAMPEADAQLFRWRLYHTGAAIALLLDDMGVDDWKARVQAGEALIDLLKHAVDTADAAVPPQ